MARTEARVHSQERDFLVGLARAFGGAIFFSLPLLMTMEMWSFGFAMEPGRLVLFMVVMVPMLIGLDHYSGFRDTSRWWEDVVDGITAYGVGFIAAGGILLLFNVIEVTMPLRELVGKVSLQAIPAAFGAVLANSQLGPDRPGSEIDEMEPGYGAEIFLMSAGSLFLAFNLAPTEEMVLIAFMMTPKHGLALLAVSLLLMHAFVYGVEFKGSHVVPEGVPWWSLFLRFTVVGYAVALLISGYVLWTFGRFEQIDLSMALMETVVLGFPAALGAAGARLVV